MCFSYPHSELGNCLWLYQRLEDRQANLHRHVINIESMHKYLHMPTYETKILMYNC